jgi:hypothetical protein
MISLVSLSAMVTFAPARHLLVPSFNRAVPAGS